MALPLIAAAAGLALGAMKYGKDKTNERKDRRMRAIETALSPWTQMKPETQVQRADLMGNLMQGGASGLAMGQGVGDWQQGQALTDAKIGKLKSDSAWMGLGGAEEAAAAAAPSDDLSLGDLHETIDGFKGQQAEAAKMKNAWLAMRQTPSLSDDDLEFEAARTIQRDRMGRRPAGY